ncbi:serine/threonine protein phosphatase [Microbacterium sp. Root61]|uniref:PP2C family protein-serine/threonine phosphatase n=1 Tax=Microbacterium sp. Root61 TaxID=1736570 RepID=UPI0006FB96C8|nr:protein phosphatase 2C domain-containing protein [Microbacterium sp. Root61]KRA23092.1 serine/threonine protein phosphatase [Microbacterium sp. Root61]
MRLDAAAVSDVGPYRSANQDSAFAASWGAAVADGVGGGPAGDLASAALLHRLVAGARGTVNDAADLRTRIRLANWDLRAHAARDQSLVGMSTTLTGLFGSSVPGTLLMAHTGDSRGYLLRSGTMTRMTRDDSYVQELLERGLVSSEDAASHPRRNIITASLRGAEDDVVRVALVEAQHGDRWLLCSDGVTDYVPEPMLADLLRGVAVAAEAADAIVQLAIQAGTRDNVTAVVCDVEAGALPLQEEPRFAGAAAVMFSEELDSGPLSA